MPVAAQPHAPRRIGVLPPLVVNQIAAGEVVERPASVVKELLDNALDAGASQVTVELDQGGIELIRVTDNGSGIEPDDLPLAVASHATSKIKAAEELAAVATMGFRGEALASIASVSRVTIRSRPAAHDAGAAIDASGDERSAVRPEAGPVGTSVSVRNLFYNTPARRKFLRAAQTEQGHCMEVVRAAAMGRPAVGFHAICNGRTALELPAGQSARERVVGVLGEELGDKLVESSYDDPTGGITLWGLVGLPEIARPTSRGQRFFVNGRPIRDQTIQHAVQEAYRGLIDPSRRPMAVLMIELHPALVDVNVHPSKTEVRFRDSSLVHAAVYRSTRDALRHADLTPAWTNPGRTSPGEFGAGGAATDAEAFVAAFRAAMPAPGDRIDFDELRARFDAASGAAPPAPATPLPAPRPADRVLQVHNSYLVTQDDQGIVIIDQHALHERAMFEKIMDRLSRAGEDGAPGRLESQRLLAPAIVHAPAQRVEQLEGLRPALARLGVEADSIGPGAVAVHAFPTLLFDKGVDPAAFIAEVLEQAESGSLRPARSGRDEEALVHEIVDMMSCKAAVKAGDRMSEDELHALLTLRESVDRAASCPHGRPTSIRISIRDLEKRFGRT